VAFKLFRKNSDDDAVRRSDDELNGTERQDEDTAGSEVRALPDRPELPTTNGLPDIVKMMESDRVATLQLNQRGNEMTAVMDPSEKPERKTTVDTQSPWFDAVAKLYTAAQASENGPWRRAEIMISSVREGRRSVEVEYTYPNSDEQVREAYTQTLPTTLSRGGESDASGSEEASGSTSASKAGTATASGAAAGGAAGAAAGTAASGPKQGASTSTDQERDEALDAVADDAETRKSGATNESGRDDGNAVLGTPEDAGSSKDSVDSNDSRTQVVSGTEKSRVVTDAPSTEAGASNEADSATTSSFSEANAKGGQPADKSSKDATSGGAAVGGAAAGGVAAGAVAGGAAASAGSGTNKSSAAPSEDSAAAAPGQSGTQDASEPVPDVVEDSQWDGEDGRSDSASSSNVAADLPDSVPSTADQTDVAPSYSSSEQTGPQKPSTTQLAPGNLVLTEADVLKRIGEAQKTLFGPNGTARDVSTVLIRVRALGSYYDALTHVRRNGFWDQRKTFDLIPEEALHILELKSDSYQEGAGSPIAMMFRFTPGVPPQVSFSYEDEESFVKYKDRLPAQQYIEELRMFPRTGANIPEHMTDALTQWSL
jgi:hypothetical protein